MGILTRPTSGGGGSVGRGEWLAARCSIPLPVPRQGVEKGESTRGEVLWCGTYSKRVNSGGTGADLTWVKAAHSLTELSIKQRPGLYLGRVSPLFCRLPFTNRCQGRLSLSHLSPPVRNSRRFRSTDSGMEKFSRAFDRFGAVFPRFE